MEFLIDKVINFSEVINSVKSDEAKKEIALALIEEIISATAPPKEEEQQSIFGSYHPAPYPYPIPTIPNLNYNFPMGNTIKLPTSFGDSSITKSQQPSSEKKKSKSNKK